jgi:glucans biosynthesis protein
LSSMFWFDQNSHAPYADFRPEVHDSDGLELHTGTGQWIWRPLDPGKAARVNSYLDLSPKGFGLMQRQRNFEQYADLVARYDLRPSAWIEPSGDWGAGRVELIQLPTDNEYTDNIVAFWVPSEPPKPGTALDCAYAVHWVSDPVETSALGSVRATYLGRAVMTAERTPLLRFVVEFDSSRMQALAASEPLDAEVHCGPAAKLITHAVFKNEVNGAWRLVIEITVPDKAVDIDARLICHGQPVTETWAYTWQP